jgi:hypothetical protein
VKSPSCSAGDDRERHRQIGASGGTLGPVLLEHHCIERLIEPFAETNHLFRQIERQCEPHSQ